MTYVVIYKSCNEEVDCCEFITSNYNEAVGFIENSIHERKRDIEKNNVYLKRNGKENEIEKIVDVNRYDNCCDNSYHQWILRLNYKGNIEEEVWQLYKYNIQENQGGML